MSSDRALTGWYARNDAEPDGQDPIVPTLTTLEGQSKLYGIAELPGGDLVPCGVIIVRGEGAKDDSDAGSGWITLFLPMGSLGDVFDVGAFPFGDAPSEAWRIHIDDWLAGIARRVFDRVAFTLALVGHEVIGEAKHDEIARDGLPPNRWFGYLIPTNNRLDWYPPTNYDPPIHFTAE